MRSVAIVLTLFLATACSAPSNGNATEANAVEPAPAMEITNVAPYTVGPDGERWTQGTTVAKEPYALYGAPNTNVNDVILKCAPNGLFVSLDADPATARGGAVITSGEARFEMPPTPPASLADFVVPYAEPLLSAMPSTGLIVTYKNGEKSAFPGGPVVAQIIAECRKRNVAGG